MNSLLDYCVKIPIVSLHLPPLLQSVENLSMYSVKKGMSNGFSLAVNKTYLELPTQFLCWPDQASSQRRQLPLYTQRRRKNSLLSLSAVQHQIGQDPVTITLLLEKKNLEWQWSFINYYLHRKVYWMPKHLKENKNWQKCGKFQSPAVPMIVSTHLSCFRIHRVPSLI